MEKTQKEVVLSLITIAILVAALLFVSFAAFVYTGTGQTENKITTGTVSMSFTETTPGIKITKAHPITDDEGKAMLKKDDTQEQTVTSGYFDFTVSAELSGDMNIGYDIYLENITETAPILPDKYVKVYLSDAESEEALDGYEDVVPNYGSFSPVEKETSKRIIYHGILNRLAPSKTIRLRIWVADTYGENESNEVYIGENTGVESTSKHFKARVGILASQEL